MSLPDHSGGADSGGPADGQLRVVCPGCGLLCDDILLGNSASSRFERACEQGRARLAGAWEKGGAVEAMLEGRSAGRHEAIEAAAAAICGARRVLVTGLAGVTLRSVLAAADLAERVGGAFDADAAETARATGPGIARVGSLTADFEELRDRADCVLLWFVDPSASHPRFFERFVEPPRLGGRQLVAVGTPPPAGAIYCGIGPDDSAEAAAVLEMLLVGDEADSALRPPAWRQLASQLAPVAEVVRGAGCLAVVTDASRRGSGVESLAVAKLVRAAAHRGAAFEVPLAWGIDRGGSGSGAAAVSSWRYAAAGGVARADRLGGEYLPAEADARRLVARGEVDLVVAVGPLAPPLAEALGRSGAGLVELAESPGIASARGVFLQVASPVAEGGGVMLRADGRELRLPEIASCQPTAAAVLGEIIVAIGEGPR